jgi:hypothetical protein
VQEFVHLVVLSDAHNRHEETGKHLLSFLPTTTTPTTTTSSIPPVILIHCCDILLIVVL